jgi:hypothetical protein
MRKDSLHIIDEIFDAHIVASIVEYHTNPDLGEPFTHFEVQLSSLAGAPLWTVYDYEIDSVQRVLAKAQDAIDRYAEKEEQVEAEAF